MATYIRVNIDPGNDLLPGGTLLYLCEKAIFFQKFGQDY